MPRTAPVADPAEHAVRAVRRGPEPMMKQIGGEEIRETRTSTP
jgi:hypothetical protein